MSATKIEWAHVPGTERGETWNPVVGCSRASEGCRNCYAERMAARLAKIPATAERYGRVVGLDGRWNGKLVMADYRTRELPLRVKRPTTFFVNSMGDLFHPVMDQGDVLVIYDIMRRCPQHTFIVCTKRPERIMPILYGGGERYKRPVFEIGEFAPNIWHLTSVEDQATADRRIPELLKLRTEGADGWPVLGISAEPMLGMVDVTPYIHFHQPEEAICGAQECGGCIDDDDKPCEAYIAERDKPTLDWVICGGESGPGARPFNVAWARDLRDQCKAAGVAFFMKQMGAKPIFSDIAGDVWTRLKSRKGADMAEWSEDFQDAREFPKMEGAGQ